MRTFTKPFWAGLFLVLATALPAKAGDVNVVGRFDNAGITAEIDTYTDGGVVVATVALKTRGKSVTFAFDRNDWPALEKLWNSAKQQDGSKYVSVGSLTEVGTSEKCIIALAGGPAIRLTVVSPIDGALVFDVTRYSLVEFDAKLKEAASQTTAS